MTDYPFKRGEHWRFDFNIKDAAGAAVEIDPADLLEFRLKRLGTSILKHVRADMLVTDASAGEVSVIITDAMQDDAEILNQNLNYTFEFTYKSSTLGTSVQHTGTLVVQRSLLEAHP
jgi:hypothetical protein